MKRYYILMLLLVSMVGTVYAQVETHYYKKGNPDVSIKRSVRSNRKVNRMPSFDLAALQREDAKKDSMGGFFRFGKGFDVGYTLADGQWENVEGGRLWTMTFASANALSISRTELRLRTCRNLEGRNGHLKPIMRQQDAKCIA